MGGLIGRLVLELGKFSAKPWFAKINGLMTLGTPHLGALDIHDAATAGALGLDTVLVDRARWVHDTLRNGAMPAHIRYSYFAGTGHETATRVKVASGCLRLRKTHRSITAACGRAHSAFR